MIMSGVRIDLAGIFGGIQNNIFYSPYCVGQIMICVVCHQCTLCIKRATNGRCFCLVSLPSSPPPSSQRPASCLPTHSWSWLGNLCVFLSPVGRRGCQLMKGRKQKEATSCLWVRASASASILAVRLPRGTARLSNWLWHIVPPPSPRARWPSFNYTRARWMPEKLLKMSLKKSHLKRYILIKIGGSYLPFK